MSSIVLFDGVCNLCNGAVQFIIRHDKKNLFRFASLQSATAAKLLDTLPVETSMQSVVLIEQEKVFVKSRAILQIARQLEFPINLVYGFIIVPRFIRDAVYVFIAKHRYKWFGKKNECMIPSPALKSKFFD